VTTPPGIVLDRHLHLDDRRWPLLFRRTVLTLIAVIVLAALLDVFGQKTDASRAVGTGGAVLTVASPRTVRGGLMFTTRFTIDARTRLAQPTLVLDSGWLAGMQVNSVVPQPKDETSVDGRTVWTFPAVPAGGRQDYFVGFQVDATTLGRQRQTVRLLDGDAPLATIRRSLTVLP
jgi:hypothetical protein